MKQILFVCTGNTCRSPMAKVVAEDIIEKLNLDCKVDSAGINVVLPTAASTEAMNAVAKIGLDLSDHIPKQATITDFENSDLVLTMAENHKKYILSGYQYLSDRVFTLSEFANDKIEDIEDPYGGSLETYEKCLSQIKKYVTEVMKKIK